LRYQLTSAADVRSAQRECRAKEKGEERMCCQSRA
jgi:hypothetical protein